MHKSLARRIAASGQSGREMTFKTKMERLADRNSTNLYFEGRIRFIFLPFSILVRSSSLVDVNVSLPLSIDEPTLAVLVSPYHTKSWRFFQTKLSDLPRIIAFFR